MGLVRNLIERRSTLANPSDALREALGVIPTEAGITVNEQTALRMIAVYSCIRVLGESVASLPLHLYERMEPRGRQRASSHRMYEMLNAAPNEEMNSFTYWETVIAHLSAWGNHYSEIERRDGVPVALWPLPPNRMTVRRAENGQLQYVYNGGDRTFRPDEIFAIPLLGFNGLQGFSPIGMARRAIGVGLAAEMYGARFFEADARPGIVLSHPGQLSDVARQNLEQSWQERHAGVGKSWRVKVLEEGMSVSAVGIPPKDAQFLELRRFQVTEIARLFRVPPHLIADVERSTSWGTGIEQQNIGLVVYTLRPYLVRIERAIRQQLIPPSERGRFYAEFLVDGLLRGDAQARSSAYATGRQWGWWSANDVREMENQNPVEGGDTYLQPLNMIDARLGSNPEDLPTSEPGRSVRASETRAARQMRSATARRRLANAHIATFRDVAARLIRIEQTDVRAAVKRHLRERGIDEFQRWVREYYYDKFPARVEDYWQGPMRTLVEAIAAEAADEVDGEMPAADEMDTWAREYVATLALRHCGDSRSRLLALARDDADDRAARDAESLADAVDDELDAWGERPDDIAHEEAHRGSNATASWAFGLLGVLALRWVTFGSEPCDYCKGMAGRQVPIGAAFLAAGAGFAPGGIAPLISRSSIGHPPLHDHCECAIVAV